MIQKTLDIIMRGTAQVIPESDLVKKLSSGKKLQIKLGMDPTAPDLHLGHVVVLEKMREFQDLGHEAILVIGDFTAYIGDPTGRSKTRPPLTTEDIAHNQKTYLEQAGKILNSATLRVTYNSTWLGALSFTDLVKLCAKTTLARIMERDDFQKRFADHSPIGFHELLYPLMQAYDSVALKADVELGGTDQTFNLLMGRFLQEQFGQEPQVVLTMPLLEGLDGVQKMSKSYGNSIGIIEQPHQVFGKMMSVSDQLMWRYYQLLLHASANEITQMQYDVANQTLHPMKLKKDLAEKLIAKWWSADQAAAARIQFEQVFQERKHDKGAPFVVPSGTAASLWIVDMLKLLGITESSSQARRLIESGAVQVNGMPVTEFKAMIDWQKGMIIKAGKHHIYILE